MKYDDIAINCTVCKSEDIPTPGSHFEDAKAHLVRTSATVGLGVRTTAAACSCSCKSNFLLLLLLPLLLLLLLLHRSKVLQSPTEAVSLAKFAWTSCSPSPVHHRKCL